MPPSAHKGNKKAARPEPPCSATAHSAATDPQPDPDTVGASTSVNASAKDEESLSATSTKATTNDPAGNNEKPSSKIPSNSFSYREVPYGSEIPKPKTKLNAKKRSNAPPFTAADLERYLFSAMAMQDSEDSELAIPLHVDYSAQRLHTEKLVKLFKDSTSDKHFIEIPVDPLRGKENWREWLVAMQLLFVQHGVWEVVIKDAQPLARTHPLYCWYQRMRHCAVGLIYTNVSEAIRKQTCFLVAIVDNDPDSVMSHLHSHYGSAEDSFPEASSSTHQHNRQQK